jgi:hypothetical protein
MLNTNLLNKDNIHSMKKESLTIKVFDWFLIY